MNTLMPILFALALMAALPSQSEGANTATQQASVAQVAAE